MAGRGELHGNLSHSALSRFQKGLWCSGDGCQLSLEPAPLGKPRSTPHAATPNLPLGFQSGTNSPQGHTAGQKNQSSCFPGHCGSRCRGREREAGHRWCWRGERGAGDWGWGVGWAEPPCRAGWHDHPVGCFWAPASVRVPL